MDAVVPSRDSFQVLVPLNKELDKTNTKSSEDLHLLKVGIKEHSAEYGRLLKSTDTRALMTAVFFISSFSRKVSPPGTSVKNPLDLSPEDLKRALPDWSPEQAWVPASPSL